MDIPEEKYKVLFVGDSGVGKTSFITRYCSDKFTESFIATIGIDMSIKRLERKGKSIKLEIWDTAGQERYRAITPAMYRRADGFVIMFDLTSRQTFYSCQHWVEAVIESVDTPIVTLVGNKLDLEKSRTVTLKEAKEFAARWQMEYFECSIKESAGVEEIMEHLVSGLIARSIRQETTVTVSVAKTNQFEEQTDSKCKKC